MLPPDHRLPGHRTQMPADARCVHAAGNAGLPCPPAPLESPGKLATRAACRNSHRQRTDTGPARVAHRSPGQHAHAQFPAQDLAHPPAAALGEPTSPPRPATYCRSTKQRQDVGSGAGAVALSGVRSCSHFSPGFPCGPLHCSDHGRALRFQPPPLRTVHAVLPHTAHRRRSPPAFGLSRQGFPALGATTIPYKLIRPRSAGAEVSITRHPKARLRRCFLLMNSASRIRA